MAESILGEFKEATKEEQIARLEGLGRAALEEFGVKPVSMESLVHAENTTFRVASDQGDFCLRISRPGYQSNANVRSEIAFLTSLSEKGFRVPDPWQPRVVTASSAGVPEARDCVLFRWIDGEIHRTGLTLAQTAKVGELMAQLHVFVESWKEPGGFDRQRLHTWLLDAEEPMAIDSPSEMIEEENRQFLVGVVRESRDLAASLPRDSDWLRLIHSDLHHGNVVFTDEVVSAIDFDDTGYGFLLYDFAAALCVRLGRENYPDYQAAFIEGYSGVRPLPPRLEELFPQFLALRLAMICNWVVSRTDNPEFREIGPRWTGSMCDRIRGIAP